MEEIRSYVVRATRMSDHQKDAYHRLYDRFCLPVPALGPTPAPVELPRIEWKETFPHRAEASSDEPERPIILDIGFGMGYELAELADAWRHTDFLGVEVHKPGVGKLLSEIERRSLDNVRIARYDAVAVCRRMIPPATLAGIHLFFPDPWPKKRHHKRRLVRPGFPELVTPLLRRDGGYLYLVTDWENYAHWMREVLDASPLLLNRYGGGEGDDGFAPPQPWRPRTAFERKGLRKGHRIFELLYHRVSEPA